MCVAQKSSTETSSMNGKARERNPEDETEPRIMIQILYNLIRHIQDDPQTPKEIEKYGYWNAWACGLAQQRIRKLKKLAKVYVQKTGGIV